MITGNELLKKIEQGWKVCPPNPLYEREYVCSLDGGRAVLTISAPGGKIDRQNAQDVIDWMELILTTLRRVTAESSATEP